MNILCSLIFDDYFWSEESQNEQVNHQYQFIVFWNLPNWLASQYTLL